MFVPIILGSDKTTVSVATGNNEYWPIYISTGNVHNCARHGHGQAVSLLGFLAIPKSKYIITIFEHSNLIKTKIVIADREFEKDPEFCTFHRQLFHASLTAVFETMKPAMEKPEVTLCADGHFRRAIYGLGPYIADYPEQVLLACIVQGWCPK